MKNGIFGKTIKNMIKLSKGKNEKVIALMKVDKGINES